jgi:beta-glucanase (GH16 family)
LIDSESGSVEHTFSKEGVHLYNFVVWAYSETGQFVNKTLDVDILKTNDVFTNLVFSDEFEYEGKLDEDKWFHQIIAPNNGGWFNGEVQHYTDREENSFVIDGTLKIKAIKENYTFDGSTQSYTSARLNSKFVFQYGRVEVRAKLPKEPGTWPAIWTLGANINERGNYFGNQYGSVGWPACGEIDIMEQKGADKSKTLGYFHWGDTNTGEYKTQGNEIAVPNTAEKFHIYGMVWNEGSIRLTVDDKLIIDLPNTQDKPFDNLHYLILNIAMGGNLGGQILPNFSEDTFEIDYVRIYQ